MGGLFPVPPCTFEAGSRRARIISSCRVAYKNSLIMKQSQRIAKNALFGLVAGVVGGALQFLSILIVAWHLGVEDFGNFSYLLAFGTIVQFVADFGLSRILVREMTLYPGQLEHLLGNAKGLLWILFGVALLLAFAVISLLPVPPHLRLLLCIMSMGSLCQLHTIGYASVLIATENMEFNSIAFILHKIVLVSLLELFLSCHGGLLGVVLAYLSANIFLWVYYHLVVAIGFFPGRLRYHVNLWKRLFMDSISMAGGMIMRQFSWQMDLLVLGWCTGPIALGYFSSPFRMLLALTLIPVLLAQPLFPLFVRLARESIEQLDGLYRKTLTWFCLLSFPPMAVGFAWPKACLLICFGSHFLPAAPALKVLSLAAIPACASVLYPYLFSALNRQGNFFLVILAFALLRLALEVIFVPRWGYMAECYIIVAMEVGLFATLAWRLRPLGLALRLGSFLGKPALAGLPCLLLLIYFPHATFPWTCICLSLCVVIYPALLWQCHTLQSEDLLLMRDSLGFFKPYWNKILAKSPFLRGLSFRQTCL